jgi:[ribosomal protein S18]-alanine N-acetyltransferase
VPFVIRDFKPDDFELLWRLDQECFPPGISYSRSELKAFIRHARTFTLVAQQAAEGAGEAMEEGSQGHATGSTNHSQRTEAQPAGFIVAAGGPIGHVITIDVRASARRSGVGSLLLETAEGRLRASGSEAVGLETAVDNVGALSFYKRHGYSVTRTWPRYYSNGVDALVMRKKFA